MKKRAFIGSIIGIIVMALGMTACKDSSVTAKVVTKTYSLVCNVGDYVTNIDSTNLISRAQSLLAPMDTLSEALTFITKNINDDKVKTYLTQANSYIQTISVLIKTVKPEDADKFKISILGYVLNTKATLEKAADVLGVSLSARSFNGDFKEIGEQANELHLMIRNN